MGSTRYPRYHIYHIISYMISDNLIVASYHTYLQCTRDSKALSNLSDGVLYLIQSSCDERLHEARAIVDKLHRRKFVSEVMMLILLVL